MVLYVGKVPSAPRLGIRGDCMIYQSHSVTRHHERNGPSPFRRCRFQLSQKHLAREADLQRAHAAIARRPEVTAITRSLFATPRPATAAAAATYPGPYSGPVPRSASSWGTTTPAGFLPARAATAVPGTRRHGKGGFAAAPAGGSAWAEHLPEVEEDYEEDCPVENPIVAAAAMTRAERKHRCVR